MPQLKTSPDPTSPAYLPALNSLRFFAAAMIVVHHAKRHFGIFPIFDKIIFLQGVSFFFVLSGFVLTYAYGAFEQKTRIVSFWMARFARIWPLHVATLVLTIILFYRRIDDPAVFLANLGMVHAWIPLKHFFFSYNYLSWAVSTEFALYLCFPLLIRNWAKTWLLKTVLALLLLLLIIAVCNRINLPHLPVGGIGFAAMVYISPLGRLFEFCLGMATALIYKKCLHCYQPSGIIGTFMETSVYALTLLIIVHSNHLASLLLPWIGIVGHYWIQLGGVSALFFAGMILVTALNKGALSYLLSSKVLVFLGDISFAMYLLHQIMLRFYVDFIAGSLNLSNGLIYGLYWVFLIAASAFTWHFFENPSRKWILYGFGFIQEKRLQRSLSIKPHSNT